MPYRQDLDTGEWVEVDAQGNPVAGGPQIMRLPPNPVEQAREARAQAAAERAERTAADAAADRAADNARADRALGLQEAAAERAAQKAGGKGGVDAAAKIRAARSLQQQLDSMRDIYERSFKGMGPIQSLKEYLPTEDAERFRALARTMRADLKPLIRGPGEGTFTEGDQALLDQLIPDPKAFDSYNEQLFEELQNRISGTLEQYGQADDPGSLAPPPDPSPPELPPAGQGGNEPVNPWSKNLGMDQPGSVAASGGMRTERDPRISAQVDAMINAGAGEATINAMLKSKGWAPLPLGSLAAARKWMKENPGKSYYGASAEREVPLNIGQQIAGSPLGAGAAHYANAATAGSVGALSGDRGRGALDAMQAMNPNAAMAGTLAGGVTGALGGELALGARLAGTGLARFAPRMADAAYGGLYGFNEAPEGEGLTGAVTGAGLGALGGAVGERAMRGAGAVARGVSDPAVQRLRELGVPLTFGQAVGQSGPVGAGVKKMEDALTSIPGVGNMIERRRMEGLRGFNRAAFDIGAETTGNQVEDIGAAGIGQLDALKDAAYRRALDPVRIDANEERLIDDLANSLRSAQGIPNVNGAQDAAVSGLESRITGALGPDETISGRGFQEAYRGLARTGRERASSDYGHEIGQVMRQGQDALAGALERQNPGAYEGFLDANASNRRLNILADAVGRAKNADNDIFTPAQLEAADFGSANKLTGKISAARGARPFAELAEAGQQVLPSRLPDSGTATRALTGLALSGAAGASAGGATGGLEGATTGSGLGLGAMLALMLGGSRGSQRALTGAVLSRPAVARAVGEAIQRNAQIGGGFGAGVLTPLLVGSQ